MMEETTLNDAPRSVRVHIGIFGRRNAGKSSLINAVAGHDVSIVSDMAGTTTDPVYKSIELAGIGPCVLIDTAGFDDTGAIGRLRTEKTGLAVKKTDVALLLTAADSWTEPADHSDEKEWLNDLKKNGITVLLVFSKCELAGQEALSAAEAYFGEKAWSFSAVTRQGVEGLRGEILRLLPADLGEDSLLGDMVTAGDTVLLVMPQDIQAPKGRLILPQVQTLRELLDKKCLAMCCVTEKMGEALSAMTTPPKLIITDSQAFKTVFAQKPAESMLTSFSVLQAGYKGDLPTLIEGAKAIGALTPHSRVLIAEACTHAPIKEDIGREKIPAILRKRFPGIDIRFVRGTDYPESLEGTDLVIHCGGCMFNRAFMMNRIRETKDRGVPITNYGVFLAACAGILEDVDWPGKPER